MKNRSYSLGPIFVVAIIIGAIYLLTTQQAMRETSVDNIPASFFARQGAPFFDGIKNDFDIAPKDLSQLSVEYNTGQTFKFDLLVKNNMGIGSMWVQCSLLDYDQHKTWLATHPKIGVRQVVAQQPSEQLNCKAYEPYSRTALVTAFNSYELTTVHYEIPVPPFENTVLFCEAFEQCVSAGDIMSSSSFYTDIYTFQTADECVSGMRKCSGTSAYLDCQQIDGTFKWSTTPNLCQIGYTCAIYNGNCYPTCDPECNIGDIDCIDSTHYKKCRYNADECLIWSSSKTTISDQICFDDQLITPTLGCDSPGQYCDYACKGTTEIWWFDVDKTPIKLVKKCPEGYECIRTAEMLSGSTGIYLAECISKKYMQPSPTPSKNYVCCSTISGYIWQLDTCNQGVLQIDAEPDYKCPQPKPGTSPTPTPTPSGEIIIEEQVCCDRKGDYSWSYGYHAISLCYPDKIDSTNLKCTGQPTPIPQPSPTITTSPVQSQAPIEFVCCGAAGSYDWKYKNECSLGMFTNIVDNSYCAGKPTPSPTATPPPDEVVCCFKGWLVFGSYGMHPYSECDRSKVDMTGVKCVAEKITQKAYLNPLDNNEYCLDTLIGEDKCYGRKAPIELSELDLIEKNKLFYNPFIDASNPICVNAYGDITCQEGAVCLAAKNSAQYPENKKVYDRLKSALRENAQVASTWAANILSLGIVPLIDYATDGAVFGVESYTEKYGVCVFEERGPIDTASRWIQKTFNVNESTSQIIFWVGIGIGALMILALLRPRQPSMFIGR